MLSIYSLYLSSSKAPTLDPSEGLYRSLGGFYSKFAEVSSKLNETSIFTPVSGAFGGTCLDGLITVIFSSSSIFVSVIASYLVSSFNSYSYFGSACCFGSSV